MVICYSACSTLPCSGACSFHTAWDFFPFLLGIRTAVSLSTVNTYVHKQPSQNQRHYLGGAGELLYGTVKAGILLPATL